MRFALSSSVLTLLALSCANGGAPGTLALSTDVETAPADGIAAVSVVASVAQPAEPGAVVTFALDGVGLLSATNALVMSDAGAEQASAAVELFAPFEDELGLEPAVISTVSAQLSTNGQLFQSARTITFTRPTTGAALITARTVPDRVVAGSGESITLVLDGRRLADPTVTLTASPAGIVELPPTLTLALDDASGLFHGELAIASPAQPAEVTLIVAGEGAPAIELVLHFISSDAPAFDLNGTFAEVQYSIVRIGGLVFLDPNPQCVVAPTLSLKTIAHDGAHVSIASETCDIKMPSVNVVILGTSTTWVDPSFVAAVNAKSGGPLEFDLADVGLGATFAPAASAFGPPLIVGAALAHPDDPLPTNEDDPAQRDDDNDGHAGVTVHNSTQGDQYTAYRARTTSMRGTIQSSDAISGFTEGETQTNILNGSGITPTMTALPAPFHTRRVDGRNGAPDIAGRDGDASSISCADVQAYANELMAAAPAPSIACE